MVSAVTEIIMWIITAHSTLKVKEGKEEGEETAIAFGGPSLLCSARYGLANEER